MSNYMIKIELELENISPFWSGKDREIIIDKDKNIRIFGSSIYGAIKSQIKSSEDKAEELFGLFDNERKNLQESKVFISDMKSHIKKEGIKVEERVGIRIDNKLGSTVSRGLYSTLLIPEGDRFKLKVEAKQLTKDEKEAFYRIFNEVIEKIQTGKICFGGNKTNGFGQFKVVKYYKKEFDLTNRDDLITYLDWSEDDNNHKMEEINLKDEKVFDITFRGEIKDSLLIRGETVKEREKTIQYSYKEEKYIIPSKTIKGGMRSYFGKILNTLNGEVKNDFKYSNSEKRRKENPKEYEEIIKLLGHNPDSKINNGEYYMGKLLVDDGLIKNSNETEYHRIKIDRFTGGNMNGSMINEKRLTSGDIEINVRVRDKLTSEEKVLLFLYFRDLGLGKIILGGNAGVGSGRIKGISAIIDDLSFHFEYIEDKIILKSEKESEIKKLFKNLNWGDN